MIKDSLNDKNHKIFSNVFTLYPDIFKDDRGFFYESWNKKELEILTNRQINFVQDNHSCSRAGVIRGLHFQLPPFEQAKLIRVIKGEIFDVFIDLRKESETFKSWGGIILNDTNKKMLWLPEGFAHGFLSLKDDTEVLYKVNNYWNSDCERTLIWNDKEVDIKWPIDNYKFKKLLISKKDRSGLSLNEIISKGDIF